MAAPREPTHTPHWPIPGVRSTIIPARAGRLPAPIRTAHAPRRVCVGSRGAALAPALVDQTRLTSGAPRSSAPVSIPAPAAGPGRSAI